MKIALTIAGSDSGGGAGIQADLKTFHQFGVFGTSAVVAITAQNTRGVRGAYPIPLELVRSQLAALAEDLTPDAVKTGMLATAALVEGVASAVAEHGFPNLVVDPVMVASSGDRLLDENAVETVADVLIPRARIVTPNRDEAQLLTGREIETEHDMIDAGRQLLERGASAALVKGGHLRGATVVDMLVTANGNRRFEHPRIDTSSTHGTGCTLSAAIAAGLALGRSLEDAVERALAFVHRAIATAPGLGHGHGPLNHFVPADDS